ncbi:peptidoglycan-binding protein [Myxococcus sp. RHSTA-1-4]|uniref:peptidoglycan-binding protein n=1 Tax=Myxococcus sp. RHSTA-1-4 TaxID=2874601 RepID=UPI001CBCD421|nr:peptidoglycan-binding protein [Myxococcus sp. RHSTA-1-4]MBZ4423253.1 peptidoglycan-binding protein [Myxococcus sp. RHSTA-1-4]
MSVRSATLSAPSYRAASPAPTVRYDGSKPAAGTTNTNAAQVTNPPLKGDPKNRNADTYNQVINQFGVGVNPRYTPRDSSGDGVKDTFCNIFLWDVTRAMGAEIPHWVDGNGNSVAPGKGREMNANATVDWMNKHGARNGWRKVSAEEAQKMANAGHPTVALWKNPSGIGHVGVIRPGEVTDRGPALAQAGGSNFNNKHVKDGFGSRPVEYWVNDSGKATGKPPTEPTKPPTTPPTPPPSTGSVSVPKTDMKRGAEGPEVRKLQDALVKLGYMTQAQVNTGPGIFGPKTEAAVAKFQKDHGITPNSGIFGPKTRAAMTEALKGKGGTEKPGTSGPVTGPTKPTGSDATKAANIDKILKGTGLAGQGAHIVAMSKKYNVPAELALAMFRKEASFMTAGSAVKNNNPGNLRFAEWERQFGGQPNGSFAKFPDTKSGVEAYFRLLGGPAYRGFIDRGDYKGLINKYAPPTENDSGLYHKQVLQWMQEYKAKIG